MIASVIITIKIAGATEQYDMELPADTPVSELSPKLLMALRNIGSDRFGCVEGIKLKSEEYNRYLDDGETLESAGIWDGSTVTIERSV